MPLLLLDLDDTLVSRQRVFAGWAFEFAQAFRGEADLVEWLIQEDAGGNRLRTDFWAAISARLSLQESPSQLAAAWPATFGSRYSLDDQTRSAMDRARAAGWKLGLVTNGGAAAQEAKIQATGLRDLLDTICISEIERVSKPDPLMFVRAAQRCGVPLAGGWMIGDNPITDITGSHAAGLSSGWVSGADEDWPAQLPPPTLRFTTVAEAITTVINLE